MIYLLNAYNSANWPHITGAYARQLCHAFNAIGVDAMVLHRSKQEKVMEDKVIPGVMLCDITTANFGKSDTVICTSPVGVDVLMERYDQFVKATKICWLMSDNRPEAHDKFDYSFFSTDYHRRFGYGELLLPGIYEGPIPDMAELERPAVVFAGRIGSVEYSATLTRIAQSLPHHHFYVISSSIRHHGVTYVGSYHSRDLRSPQMIRGEMHLPRDQFFEMSGKCMPAVNIRFQGPKMWGDHWKYLLAADVLVDFGSCQKPVAVNIKVMDYLRAHAPIITDSRCPTGKMVSQHGAGHVVGWRSIKEYSEAIDKASPRTCTHSEVMNKEGLKCRARHLMKYAA